MSRSLLVQVMRAEARSAFATRDPTLMAFVRAVVDHPGAGAAHGAMRISL